MFLATKALLGLVTAKNPGLLGKPNIGLRWSAESDAVERGLDEILSKILNFSSQ